MKKLLTLLTIMLSTLFNDSIGQQQTYSFEYDYNGNRRLRTIDLGGEEGMMAKSTAKDSSSLKEYKETIDKLEVTLFPNPTQGLIYINLLNLEKQKTAAIQVFDSRGQIVKSVNPAEESNRIDLSELPSAIYYIRIFAGEKYSEWKVIKR